MGTSFAPYQRLRDLAASAALYTYFSLGFLLVFCWAYLFFHLFSRNREARFQWLTHWFYRGFFFLLRRVMPRADLRVAEDVKSIRSSVVVCNHLSYLDPLLFMSLYARHKTIAKNSVFHAPFFSWILNVSGYLPAAATGRDAPAVIRGLEAMPGFLASGGNLFVFPEGTRSRDGTMGPFGKGAFRIARRCRAPIQVLRIRGSDRRFRPGKVLFNNCDRIVVTVERLGTLAPEDAALGGSLSRVMEAARALYLRDGTEPP